MSALDADQLLVRRAGRAVAWQTAAAVAVLVALMGVALLVVEAHQQTVQARELSRQAWSTADDATDPPAGVWLLVVTPSGGRKDSPGAPASIRRLDPRGLPDGDAHLDVDGREAQVFTGPRKGGRVSAVYDTARGELERQRLIEALIAASVVGVAGAVVLGQIIGRRAVRPLASALTLQRRFVADASHELRTPLTILRTRAQLLARRLAGRLDPASGAELEQLVADSRVLGDVIGDMLLAAEVGGRVGGGEPVDLCGLADDVVASMRGLADERSVRLVARHDDGPAVVVGAAVAIRRAVSSLVDNALSHTPPGGNVCVEVTSGGSGAVVLVADDGEGLDPATASTLVQRFARGAAGPGGGRRFGLGLALVDEVARAHGGGLVIDGQPGQGARFSLQLPAGGR